VVLTPLCIQPTFPEHSERALLWLCLTHRQPSSDLIQSDCAVQYFIDISLKDCCYSDTRDNYFLPVFFEMFLPPPLPGSSHSCGELFCINQLVEY